VARRHGTSLTRGGSAGGTGNCGRGMGGTAGQGKDRRVMGGMGDRATEGEPGSGLWRLTD
jgi:hypothetical protein